MITINTEYERSDERGRLIQINSGEWKQVNYLLIKQGQTFGGHYHKKKKEIFYIIEGKLRMIVQNMKQPDIIHDFVMKDGDTVLIEPFDLHILTALADVKVIELLSEYYCQEDTCVR